MFRRYGCASLIPALILSALMPLVASEANAAVPPNDRCSGAEVIPPAGPFPYLSKLVPDITMATQSGDPTPTCAVPVSRGIWYTFKPTETGAYQFSTCDGVTGTTVFDTVVGVYRSSTGVCGGTMTQIANGCGDDECNKRSLLNVFLNAGTTYFIVASSWGNIAPAPGETAMQLEVNRDPANDLCTNAVALSLDQSVSASLVLKTNNYEVSTSAPNCYTLPSSPAPIGQASTPSNAPGPDAAFSFTAPADGSYTFRAQASIGGGNLILHVGATCPAGPGPHTLTDCLGAADRNPQVGPSVATEEVSCVPLTAGQTVYVYVDESSAQSGGGRYKLEATECKRELEPNDGILQGTPLSCGLTGSIFPAFDEDYFELGTPPAGSRVFAMASGVASNDGDFDMRITTQTDTLEFDDSNNSSAWGDGSPNIAGCALTGTPSFLKMTHFYTLTSAEPYRLYAVTQPPGSGLGNSSATPESEPNDTVDQATTAGNMFFSGTIATGGTMGDRDLFKFCADEGEVIFLSIDGDPLRDETPLDATVLLLDNLGRQLFSQSDLGNFSISAPSPNTLAGTTPASPGESALYRATYTGVHYAGIQTQFSGEPYGMGDYLYSISRDCVSGSEAHTDLGVSVTSIPTSVGSNEPLALKVAVANEGPRTALDATWTMTIPPTTTFVSITSAPDWTCKAMGSNIECTTTCFPKATVASFDVQLRTNMCIPPTKMLHVARVHAKTPDINTANDTGTGNTTVNDGSACEDGDVCTIGDTCQLGVCVAGMPNDCNDGNACTDDACISGSGCMHTNNTNTCDDANACTTVDACQDGQCVGTAPLVCNDGNACTDDACDAATGCTTTFNAAPCDDGNPCTTADACAAGACTAGQLVDCVPLNDCQTEGICDPTTGACAFNIKPDGTACNDGNACSTNETCNAGSCVSTTSTVCPPPSDVCHGDGVCNPTTGACAYPMIGGDLDGDDLGDACDADIDGDGLNNDQETTFGTNPRSNDSDGDTIDDCTEACSRNDGSCFDGKVCKVDRPANTDGDDSIDALDSDSDDDGSSDAIEAGDNKLSTPPADSNGDGLPDYRDPNTGGTDVILTGGCGCVTSNGDTNTPTMALGLGALGLLARRWRRKQPAA